MDCITLISLCAFVYSIVYAFFIWFLVVEPYRSMYKLEKYKYRIMRIELENLYKKIEESREGA